MSVDRREQGLEDHRMTVAVLGLGYVGTVTAAVLAANGHNVRGVDIDSAKVAMLAAGRSPVVEPGLGELVDRTVASGSLSATDDLGEALAGAELSLVCVGTPSLPQGGTDISSIVRAVTAIASTLGNVEAPGSGFHALVIRSTVPPGTVNQVIEPLVAEQVASGPVRVGTGMAPEFLREGSAIADFYDSPLTVIGTEDLRVADVMRRLLHFLDGSLEVVPSSTAEGLKYACNAFHATKVSFVNELGRLFRQLGVDSRQVLKLFCEDTKLNISPQYLEPGFAFGGSCLPKDLRSLLHLGRMSSLDLPLLSATLATNALSVSDVVNRVLVSNAREVALLGLSFKMNSDDLRESPYVDLAETLIGKGINLRIYDPIVDPATLVGTNRRYVEEKLPHLQRVLTSNPADALRNVDVALVSSSHPSVVAALVADPPDLIIDLNGHLGVPAEALPGYEGVAW
jgi:GDP-mannose 6-dehydrogenase